MREFFFFSLRERESRETRHWYASRLIQRYKECEILSLGGFKTFLFRGAQCGTMLFIYVFYLGRKGSSFDILVRACIYYYIYKYKKKYIYFLFIFIFTCVCVKCREFFFPIKATHAVSTHPSDVKDARFIQRNLSFRNFRSRP